MESPLPGWTHSILGEGFLESMVTTAWHPTLYDEPHAAEMLIVPSRPRLASKLRVTGRQWLVDAKVGCTLHTELRIECTVPLVSKLIESKIAEHSKANLQRFEDDLISAMAANPDVAAPAERAPAERASAERASAERAEDPLLQLDAPTYDVHPLFESCGADVLHEAAAPCSCLSWLTRLLRGRQQHRAFELPRSEA